MFKFLVTQIVKTTRQPKRILTIPANLILRYLEDRDSAPLPNAPTHVTGATNSSLSAETMQGVDLATWESVGGAPSASNFDMRLWERRAINAAQSAGGIAQGLDAQINLVRAISYLVARGVEGDIVECGVFLGGSMVLICRALLEHGEMSRRIWLYDTFEGMPKPTDKDIWWNGTPAMNDWVHAPKIGTVGSDHVYGSLDRVTENCRGTGYPMENFIFVKGLVEDTIPREVPEKIALLRLDTDYYSSTKHELEYLYPRLVRGGVLIIDDYGASHGAQQAVDEYFRERKGLLFLVRIDPSVRFAVKI